jgi:hypothetical protein
MHLAVQADAAGARHAQIAAAGDNIALVRWRASFHSKHVSEATWFSLRIVFVYVPGGRVTVGDWVRLTSLTLSCTAKAHVPKPARRDGCDVRAAISGARKVAGGVPPSELCSIQALQRRAEAGPYQLQRGVSPPIIPPANRPLPV